MWSDRYNYYNIKFDEKFSQKLPKQTIIKTLLETNDYIQKSHQEFTNSEIFPWVYIILVETEDGNFTSSQVENQFVSLIAIISSKGKDIDQTKYIESFKNVANKLNWKLFLEEDDEGNQNIAL